MDLTIRITRSRKLEAKLFDKRDAFEFEAIRFPLMESNIHRKTLVGVAGNALLRYFRFSDQFGDFIRGAKQIRDIFLQRGVSSHMWEGIAKKFTNKYHRFRKFFIHRYQFENELRKLL